MQVVAPFPVPTLHNCRRPIFHIYLNLFTERAIKAVDAGEKHGDARGEEKRRRGTEENAHEDTDVNYFRLLFDCIKLNLFYTLNEA